jgi:mannosylglycerate hydrolase MGH1-like protein
MLTAAQLQTIDEECNRVLHQNWREGERRSDGVPFHYTCPSPGRYPWQWYWDSGFAAIAWRHFDPTHSELELRSLLAAQREDGFIGHTIFWNEPLSDWHRFTYNITSADATMTASIQPPLLAWAWRIAVGDPGEEPAIARHHAWLAEHRDLDGDGLLWIVQPDESGLDASTQFDAIWGHRAHGLAAFPLLVQRNRRMGYDLGRIAAAGGPVCCEVTTNVLYNLSRLAMGQTSLTEALITRTYDAGEGLFLPVARPQPRRRPATTVAALTPLALPDLPEEIGHRLVREHLLDPTRFWTAVPPPSVSVSDPGFSLRDTGGLRQRRYWRGPTWINTAWLCWLGLVRLGYEEQADQLAERVADAVAASGLREYYNPHTGAGMGARDFGWSSLVLEMTQGDREAARSSFLERSS